MRGVKSGLSAILAIGLLAGSAVGVAAQDEADPPTFTKNHVFGEDDTDQQVIHVWEPARRAAPRPAVVFFHGGGLVMGQPLWDSTEAQDIAELGYVTFMAGYRLFGELTGENPWPAQLDDAQHAIQWVRAHADEFNVDPDRVCAIGFSSGGHLASMVGTTDASGELDPESADISSRVDCVVTLSGDGDLTVPYDYQRWTDVFTAMFGGTLEEVPEAWQAASPAHNVDEETVPFLIIHGNRDDDVPVEMSRNLADALAKAGTEYVFAEVPTGHMDVRNPAATSALVETFLDYQLHPER